MNSHSKALRRNQNQPAACVVKIHLVLPHKNNESHGFEPIQNHIGNLRPYFLFNEIQAVAPASQVERSMHICPPLKVVVLGL